MCEHGFIGACAACDGSGQQPEEQKEEARCRFCREPLSECYCPEYEVERDKYGL